MTDTPKPISALRRAINLAESLLFDSETVPPFGGCPAEGREELAALTKIADDADALRSAPSSGDGLPVSALRRAVNLADSIDRPPFGGNERANEEYADELAALTKIADDVEALRASAAAVVANTAGALFNLKVAATAYAAVEPDQPELVEALADAALNYAAIESLTAGSRFNNIRQAAKADRFGLYGGATGMGPSRLARDAAKRTDWSCQPGVPPTGDEQVKNASAMIGDWKRAWPDLTKYSDTLKTARMSLWQFLQFAAPILGIELGAHVRPICDMLDAIERRPAAGPALERSLRSTAQHILAPGETADDIGASVLDAAAWRAMRCMAMTLALDAVRASGEKLVTAGDVLRLLEQLSTDPFPEGL